MNQAFAARVELYLAWDRRLRSRTRFFGAAALVNAALAELWPRCAPLRFVYGHGLSFLAGLGGHLQAVNLAVLGRIERGEWCAADWDASLVKLEQLAVENLLARLEKLDRRRHARIIGQMDRFLDCLARGVGRKTYGPFTAVLSRGLRELQLASPRELRFGWLPDRVAVGATLIRLIRADSGMNPAAVIPWRSSPPRFIAVATISAGTSASQSSAAAFQ